MCLTLLLATSFFNTKYEVIAVNPFWTEGQQNLKVMTWNVHCSKGTDSLRQRKIAEQVLEIDADIVLLNEYNQDSCTVTDSLLRERFPFTEETLSHNDCGDIFYCKEKMSDTGRLYERVRGKIIQPIKATVAIGEDSVKIVGTHLTSNSYDNNASLVECKEGYSFYSRYKDAQKWRSFQAYKTKEAVLKSKHPVIIMGDMNDFSRSAPLDTLLTCGLKNAWWEGGNGYGCTYHDGWLRLRIDHILYSDKLKLQSIKVIDTNLSDHNPMVAEFSVNN